ncbi:hypothetical protein WME95_46050 [Sorangium sp. So ce327]|uniref:hypothetical protein n=1 Tax=Sorangium sp. So ce327 TaxID=3133301 RepID=UPI003F5FB35B
MVVALVRRVVATSIALSPGLERIGADAFRATHGTQIVKIMHYGGYISPLFRFARLDTMTTAKVKAALDFWYGTGSVSLDSAMSSHDVWMEYEIRSDQEGGNVPLFLGTSLESLRTHLAAWHPTLADHAQPILMEVVDYKTAVPGFPYRFRSWIETPANADVSANLIGERRSAAGRGSPAPRVRAARRSERYQVYAAPAPFWGPWSVVGSHIGRATFQIAVEPIGSTVIRGEVKYYDANSTLVEQPFHDQVTIRTGDSVVNVDVRLQGVLSGSSCWVTVS